MKTMKMNKGTNKNRVGISTQKSAEVTAAGDGLALKEDKSPVTIIENLRTENKNKNEIENEVTNVITEEEKLTETDDEIEFITKEYEDNALDESAEKEEVNDSVNNSEQNKSFEKPNSSVEIMQDSLQNIPAESSIDDGKLDHSTGDKTKEMLLRGKERDAANRKVKLLEFPSCKQRIGKAKMDRAIDIATKCGFVNWEINIMFGALNSHLEQKIERQKTLRTLTKPVDAKQSEKRKTNQNEPEHEDSNKKARLDEPEVVSGILLPLVKQLEDIDKYSTFELRANIGDASHPNFYIEPCNKKKFRIEFNKFVASEGPKYNPDVPIGLVGAYFINQTFMVHCRNVQTLEFIDKNVYKLNELWPKADFLMIRRTSGRKNIQICIPYPNYKTPEILEIIEKQNRMRVEKWQVNNCVNTEDGVCLDVEVDGGTYLRLLTDQDDLFFLLKRATIKLPGNDDKLEDTSQAAQ